MTKKTDSQKSVNLLLIEDNPDDILIIQEILFEQNGCTPNFKLFSASRFQDALQSLRNEKIDVILLDLNLPDGSGADLLNRIAAVAPDLPIVVFTALNDPAHAMEIVGQGAQDYLVKGQLNHVVLRRTLLHAIERHKVRKEHLILTHELRAANSRLEKLVFSDPLTGLLNRRGLQEALSREVQRAKRDQETLLALILDLDNFKHINDSLGHAVGDVVLREISRVLEASVRVTDYVTRIGGDEFLVLMPDTRFAEGARLAEKIRRALSEAPMPLSMGSSYQMTASFGLLTVAMDVVLIDELLAQTHLVLGKSKKMGKNRVSYGRTREETEEGYASQITNILSALRHQDQYRILKQPIFELATRLPVGYEFLSRFLSPGLEMPDDFFRLSLENNILTLVDSHCLRNCIAAGNGMSMQTKQHLNIFPSTMIDIPVRNLIQLFEEGVYRGNYCVEISEQQIIGDPSYLIAPVMAMKESGISIAIDDVGFGRSSLESLILLEPDVVKIDKKWVNGISKMNGLERSLKRLLKIAEALETQVVAEGIETEEDLNALVELGVQHGQGYYLGRPA